MTNPHRHVNLAVLSSGTGWHVADLIRAAVARGHRACSLDFRRLWAGVASAPAPLAGYDAVIVRTMPPGSLEQVVFRMDLLAQAQGRGVRVFNPPRAMEACVD